MFKTNAFRKITTVVCALSLAGAILGFSSYGFSQTRSIRRSPAKEKSGKDASAGQSVTVKSGTAIVYDKPDTEASAIAYLASGETVRASKKKYGKFLKVRLSNGKFGYIATADVATAKKSTSKSKDKSNKPMTEAQAERERRAYEKRELGQPMMFNKWYGLLLGQMNYSEKTSSGKKSDNLLIYGLKFTGPDLLLGGPIVDINLFFHFGAPDYYAAISKVKPSGVLFYTDALLVLPFAMGNDGALYAGLGPLFKYTSFKYVTLGGSQKDNSSFGIGGSLMMGGAYRMGLVSARLEAKYMFEKNTQTVIQFGLQTFY